MHSVLTRTLLPLAVARPLSCMKALTYAAFITAVLCRAVGASAPMRFDRLGLDEGLSQQAVLCIAQDSHGFIWLGTEDGLNRFDGFVFEHYRRNGVRAGGMLSSFISDIEPDADGKLWIATDGGGVLRREPASGQFIDMLARVAGDKNGLDSARIVKLDRWGRLWIGSRDAGVAIYDPNQRSLARYRLDSNAIYSILLDSGGAWIGTADGLAYIHDDIKRPATRFQLGTRKWRAAGPILVRTLMEDRTGALWIGTDRGLVRLNRRTSEQTVFQADARSADALPDNDIQALLEDSAGRLWVGTAAGLALFNPQNGGFAVYKHDPADAASLPDDHIVALFEDRGGMLWIGTQLAGAAKWNPRTWSFGHQLDKTAPEGGNSITSFTQDRAGTLWIGTFGAGVRTIQASGDASYWRYDPKKPHTLSDDRVMALLTDRQNAVWVGTMGGGLNRISPDRRRIDVYRHAPERAGSLPADGIMSLFEDSSGQIWVGTYGGGLARFESATNTFQTKIQPNGAATQLAGERITALTQDADGILWVGTDGAGLHALDARTGAVHSWRHDPAVTGSISADTIYALHIDARGTLWIGTRDGGLERARRSKDKLQELTFEHYSEDHGLPNNTIYGILPDAQGDLWLSTNHGLARLSPRDGQVRSFHRSHGLQGEEFNFGAAFRSSTGELYFGGMNGYNTFTPAQLQFNEIAPEVALTGISKLNRPLQSMTSYEQLRTLDLGYRDQVVTFEFAALDFAAPRENRYRYRLEGFDSDWVDAGSRRNATYTRLAGGLYTFRVQAANADGQWSSEGLALPLAVQAPPWKRPWAYAIYALLTCLAFWAIGAGQRRKLAREELYSRRLEIEVKDRTRELADRNSALQDANQKLEIASLTDPLTGLANRRALMEALPRLAASCEDERRSSMKTGEMVLMVIDLDYFKPINDQHGHDAGDAVLKQIATILQDSTRTGSDIAARWGGDEFVAVYTGADIEEGAILAERVRLRVAKHLFKIGCDETARTSVSIGFVSYPFVRGMPGLLSHEQALNAADAALMQAKRERNSWVGWSGTPAAADIFGLPSMLECDPDAVVRQGGLVVRASPFRPEETVTALVRNIRR